MGVLRPLIASMLAENAPHATPNPKSKNPSPFPVRGLQFHFNI